MSTEKNIKLKTVSLEVATKEVESWLDYKRMSESKRKDSESSIEQLINSVADGIVTIDPDTKFINHALVFPIGNKEEIKVLNYKPRLRMHEVNTRLRKLSAGDTDGRIMVYVSALTDNSTNIIGGLDTEDNRIAQNIAIFFF